LATRIIDTFLTPGTETHICLDPNANIDSIHIGTLFMQIHDIVEPAPGLFDALNHVVLCLLQHLFDGKDLNDYWEQLPSREFSYQEGWHSSPFSQAFNRSATNVPSEEHFHSILQRIFDMPLWCEEDILQKDALISWLDLRAVDYANDLKRIPAWIDYHRDNTFLDTWRTVSLIRPRSSASRLSTTSRASSNQKTEQSSPRKSDDSPIAVQTELVAPIPKFVPTSFTIEEDVSPEDVEPQPSPRRRPRRSTTGSSPVLAAYMLSACNHNFVATTSEWCEYCLCKLGAEKGMEGYACQTCGYVCHSMCRSHISVVCCREGEVEVGEMKERLQALRMALEREANMALGLARIIAARKKIRGAQGDLELEMKESERKINSLRDEVRKCQLATRNEEAELVQISHEVEGHRVSKSMFYEKQTMPVREVIANAVLKFQLPGSAEDYQLVNVGERDVVFDATDLVVDLRVDLGGQVRLVSKVSADLSPRTEYLTQASKLREALCEVIDTEQGFVARLELTQNVYLDPIGKLEHRIEKLSVAFKKMKVLHGEILQRLLAMDARNAPLNNLEMLVVLLSNTFSQKTDQLDIYIQCLVDMSRLEKDLEKYCAGNADLEMLFKKCDNDARLGRYRLADLLIMPMHRLTRIPLLLKRVVSYLDSSSSVVVRLETTIVKFEDKVKEINSQVHTIRCNLRMAELSSNLDFANIVPFQVDKHRRLVAELSARYKRREDVVEVSVCLFDDFILIIKAKGDGRWKMFKPPVRFFLSGSDFKVPMESCTILKHTPNQMMMEFEVLHMSTEPQAHKLQATARETAEFLEQVNSARDAFAVKITNHLLEQRSL
jgi:hypothetical protein